MVLLPCPFCGASDDLLEVTEVSRIDRIKMNNRGRRRNRVWVSHRVKCYGCGASGATSHQSDLDPNAPELTDQVIEWSKSKAALSWNARQPIRDRAYDLVNRLIAEALSRTES